ncbi:MAG: hypothetical protein JXR19_01490 [Bacteroidia bacterium]
MSEIRVIEVTTKRDQRSFHKFRRELYKKDKNFISHLDVDVESLFHNQSNPHLTEGECARWLALEDGKVRGKIAAFKTPKATGIGFFDAVNEQYVANALFQTAEDWLKSKGVEQYEAPINVGERDRFWGLLIEGDRPSSFQENYNYSYYQSLFENFGFKKSFEQTTSELTPAHIDYEFVESLSTRAERIDNLRVEHIKFKELDRYVKDFVSIYNQAWSSYSYYQEVTEEEITTLFKKMKLILRENMIWFTYVGQRPVAFYVSALDVNPLFKKLNGKFGWFSKLKFLWAKRNFKFVRTRGLVFGVIPDYQNKAVFVPMMLAMFKAFNGDPFLKYIELSWIGDFNPKMHALFERIGAVKSKLHYTYEK